jgi:hypothetical protein
VPIRADQTVLPDPEKQLVPVTMEDIFGTAEPVFAEWISDDLRTWSGNRDEPDRSGSRVVYTHTRLLRIERGVITERRIQRTEVPAPRPATGLLAKLERADEVLGRRCPRGTASRF